MKDRAPAKTFEDLVVWQKSHALTLKVYTVTGSFPKHELYGLVSQMRRAAVSVGANIAEGFKRRGRPDKARFMNVAQGSLEECGTTSSLQATSASCRTASVSRSMKSAGCSARMRKPSCLPPPDFCLLFRHS
jgi:four helix bundle protein